MKREQPRGQATVEFALAITIFIVLLMGVFDLGMGIYKFNGVSQAAREIARVASVHPCTNPNACTLGDTPEVATVIAVQKGLIPNLGTPAYGCVRADGTLIPGSGSGCAPGDSIQVTVSAPYTPVTPILGLIGTWNLRSSSSVKIQ
jgi:Flp pilus assembly protein TadG